MAGTERTTPGFPEWSRDWTSPRFTEWLRDLSEPAWTAAVTHRFTRELADAVVNRDAFRRYLVQDYSFIGQFIRLLDAAIAKAPDAASKDRLTAFRAGVTGEENTYFVRSFDALEVPREVWANPVLLPVTRDLHAIMAEAAESGSYAAIITVLVATEWVYLEWATAVRHIVPEEFYFGEWIDLHANEDFRSFVNWLRQELDRHGAELPVTDQTRMADLFKRTILLEEQFFDAAYG